MKTSINNDELINSGGGWAPGKLDHDKIPFLVWPPKPLKFLKWFGTFHDGTKVTHEKLFGKKS